MKVTTVKSNMTIASSKAVDADLSFSLNFLGMLNSPAQIKKVV